VSASSFHPALYADFTSGRCDAARDLVETRLAAPAGADPLDDLVRAAPTGVQRWMERKAKLADATTPGIAVLAARTIVDVVNDLRVCDPPRRDLLAGLLHDMAGVAFRDIAARLGCSVATAGVAARAHSSALRGDPAYAALAADIVHAVLRRDFGPPRRLFDLPRALPVAGVEVVAPGLGFSGTSNVEK